MNDIQRAAQRERRREERARVEGQALRTLMGGTVPAQILTIGRNGVARIEANRFADAGAANPYIGYGDDGWTLSTDGVTATPIGGLVLQLPAIFGADAGATPSTTWTTLTTAVILPAGYSRSVSLPVLWSSYSSYHVTAMGRIVDITDEASPVVILTWQSATPFPRTMLAVTDPGDNFPAAGEADVPVVIQVKFDAADVGLIALHASPTWRIA